MPANRLAPPRNCRGEFAGRLVIQTIGGVYVDQPGITHHGNPIRQRKRFGLVVRTYSIATSGRLRRSPCSSPTISLPQLLRPMRRAVRRAAALVVGSPRRGRSRPAAVGRPRARAAAGRQTLTCRPTRASPRPDPRYRSGSYAGRASRRRHCPRPHVWKQRVLLNHNADLTTKRRRIVTSRPSSRMRPADAELNPARALSAVDLPEPDGPSSATVSPRATSGRSQ